MTGRRLCLPRFLHAFFIALIAGTGCARADLVFSDSFDSTLFGSTVAGMAENSWRKTNTNKFSDVWIPANQEAANGYGSPDRVIGAWSSMAWDSNRGYMIFYGGGHANYAGNEVYRWNANTLAWERSSVPSQAVSLGANNRWEAKDGIMNAPVSAHTYDNNEFLPIADRFVVLGGASWNTGAAFVKGPAAGPTTLTGPYFWDPDEANANQVGGTTGSAVNPAVVGGNMWQNRENFDSVPFASTGLFVQGTTAVTQENGKDVMYIGLTKQLWKYTINDAANPAADTYQLVGRAWTGYSGQGAGTYDSTRNIYLRTAGGTIAYWNLNTSGPTNNNIIVKPTDLTGGFALNANYGIDYDPIRDRYILWNGTDMWELLPPASLTTGVWRVRRISAAGTSPNTVGINPFTGVLGKWKYLPEIDLFAGITDNIKGDIWVYNPTDWSPTDSSDMMMAARGVSLASFDDDFGDASFASLAIPEPAPWMVMAGVLAMCALLLPLPMGRGRRHPIPSS